MDGSPTDGDTVRGDECINLTCEDLGDNAEIRVGHVQAGRGGIELGGEGLGLRGWRREPLLVSHLISRTH